VINVVALDRHVIDGLDAGKGLDGDNGQISVQALESFADFQPVLFTNHSQEGKSHRVIPVV
jgi:hypothetical protein